MTRSARAPVLRTLAFFTGVLLAAACGSPRTTATPRPTARPGAQPTPVLARTPAATLPPALTTPTTPVDPDFPFTLVDRLATPEAVADLRDMNAVPQYWLLQDGDGTIHLLWGASEGLWHRQLGKGGKWLAEVQLLGDDLRGANGTFAAYVDPRGEACVLWLDVERAFRQIRFAGGAWGAPGKAEIPGPYGLSRGLATVDFQLAFDAQKHMQYASWVQGDGLYVSDTLLDSEVEWPARGTYCLLIDTQNAYHALYLGRGKALNYRSSGDGGKTWSKRTMLADLPDFLESFEFAPGGAESVHVLYRGSSDRVLVERLWNARQGLGKERALHDPGALFEKAASTGDPRYLRVLDYRCSGLRDEGEGVLSFAVWSSDESIAHARVAADGHWTVTRAVAGSGGFDPVMLVARDGTAHFVYRTAEALYYARCTP